MWGLCVRVMCKGELWRGDWGGGGGVGDKWARRTQKGKTTDAVRWHHRIRISEPSSPQASGSDNVSPTDDAVISLSPTWNEHSSVSSTLIIAPALSN